MSLRHIQFIQEKQLGRNLKLIFWARQTSTMEICCKKSLRLQVVNYFDLKALQVLK